MTHVDDGLDHRIVRDDGTGPHRAEQFLLGDQTTRVQRQVAKNPKGLRPQLDRHAPTVNKRLAAKVDHETADLEPGWRHKRHFVGPVHAPPFGAPPGGGRPTVLQLATFVCFREFSALGRYFGTKFEDSFNCVSIDANQGAARSTEDV
ncbi:hypothetical protein [Variovorax sp. J22R115]|uniref:hypothetical protein n=1 Tax=Variovorax sp. J22R115 TaxID=3053509 RepID=UPI0025752A68|nr:hypothetical protein [Variovorax sp. J22R115]MDM0047712.1 hypothetical protein [Variovorax sp. J22R115]